MRMQSGAEITIRDVIEMKKKDVLEIFCEFKNEIS
jgi:hypothetical protein